MRVEWGGRVWSGWWEMKTFDGSDGVFCSGTSVQAEFRLSEKVYFVYWIRPGRSDVRYGTVTRGSTVSKSPVSGWQPIRFGTTCYYRYQILVVIVSSDIPIERLDGFCSNFQTM